MKNFAFAGALSLALVSSAHAAEATPPAPSLPASVCLTAEKLQVLLAAEQTKAVANYVANEAQQKAKGVYDQINAAFVPPKPEPSPAPAAAAK